MATITAMLHESGRAPIATPRAGAVCHAPFARAVTALPANSCGQALLEARGNADNTHGQAGTGVARTRQFFILVLPRPAATADERLAGGRREKPTASAVWAREPHALSTSDVTGRSAAEVSPDALDAADMAGLTGGDGEALDRLMQRHQRWLLGWLTRVLADVSDARDVFQEAFLRVYLHRHRFDPQRRFHSWLCTIALNLARNCLRWRRRQPPRIPLPDEGTEDGEMPGTVVNTLIEPRPHPDDAWSKGSGWMPWRERSMRCRSSCACRWSGSLSTTSRKRTSRRSFIAR